MVITILCGLVIAVLIFAGALGIIKIFLDL
jgi:hypothetical protein